jgi:3-methyl-2-oxobutanoate hydroxymethyltransferase
MSSRPPTSAQTPQSTKMSLLELVALKRRGEKIAMVTAYDAPGARLADAAGVDCILVGDSAAMTVLGRESTVSATMDEMLILTRAVIRGARRAIVIADMPFGAYQVSDDDAVRNAIRFVKEAGADAVTLEGAGRSISRVAAIVDAGIAVMGHVGLTPQTATRLGGYKVQGRTAEEAERLRQDAVELERAGCFAIVLEAIPAAAARRISEAVSIPTIGIGAGVDCDGQVLVWHDLLGLSAGHVARFVKQYAEIGDEILRALACYVNDVRTSSFPEPRHTYSMSEHERRTLETQTPGVT